MSKSNQVILTRGASRKCMLLTKTCRPREPKARGKGEASPSSAPHRRSSPLSSPCPLLRSPSFASFVWAVLLLCLPRVWLASAALLFLCSSLTHLTSPHPKRFCSAPVSDSYSWGQRYYYPCSRLTSKDKEHGCRDGAVYEGDDAQSGC